MAGGIHVGSVLVDVLPDARGWDERLAAAVAPAAEAVGKRIGKALEDDIADGVRRGLEKAKLELATVGDGHVKIKVDVDEEASAPRVKEAALKMGTQFGTDFSNATSKQTSNLSPLIAAAIAGGLALGGPAIVGAAGVAAAGVAAVFLRNQQDVAASAKEMVTEVKGAYQGIADGAIPSLTLALGKLRNAAFEVAPQVRDLFNNLDPAIQGVTDGVIGLAQGALPGLISMVKSGAPVFDGLKNFLTSIGTGLGDTFRTLSEHSQAFGQVFTSLGDVLHAVLPALGDLISAGGELGSVILPPVASALTLVGDALHLIAPILPEVALGFGAFKVVSALDGPLKTFAQNLAFASYETGPLASVAGRASTAVSGLASALPLVGTAVTLVGFAFERGAQEVSDFGNEVHGLFDKLSQGGAAAEVAARQIAFLREKASQLPSSALTDELNKQEAAYKRMLATMDPLAKAQMNAKAAQNDLNAALAKGDPAGIAAAQTRYASATSAVAHAQDLLTAAMNNTSVAEQQNTTRLQGLANAAGASNTQINLLKGALDQLTGKAVSLGDAEVAVTNAVDSAKTALQGKTGALVTATGAVNTHTAAGAALWQSMTQIASADNTLIATMEKQGATAGEVSAKDAELRDQFIQTAQQMGLTAGQAQNLANQIYGIPEQRKTEITVDTAQATQAATDLANRIAAIQSKTITVGVNYHVAGLNGGPGGTQVANARGNIIHAYADGGMEPMQGGIAQIVPPQTYRVIGDRVTDDEAYIPINNSLRSLQILAQTAGRMGYGLAGASQGIGGGGSPSHITVQLDESATHDLLEGRAVTVVSGALKTIHNAIAYGG